MSERYPVETLGDNDDDGTMVESLEALRKAVVGKRIVTVEGTRITLDDGHQVDHSSCGIYQAAAPGPSPDASAGSTELLYQAGERLAASMRASGCLRFPGSQVGECEARGLNDNHKCGPCLVVAEWVSVCAAVAHSNTTPECEGCGDRSHTSEECPENVKGPF